MRQQSLDFRVFRIHDLDQGTCHECTHADFVRENADDPELCIDIECLAVGFGFVVGDGAAPAFEIYRIR